MEDAEFEKRISNIYEKFLNWLDKKSDLLENTIKDNLSAAYFAAYEEAENTKKAENDKLKDKLKNIKSLLYSEGTNGEILADIFKEVNEG